MKDEKQKHQQALEKMKEDHQAEVQEHLDNSYKLRKEHEKEMENFR